MNQFECKSCIYRRWHHDSESSLQTVSWHGFPRTDVVSRQQQSTAQQQSEWRRWWPVRISAPQRSLLWSGWLKISTFYHQSCRTQSKNSQARMQKLQLQPTTSEFEYEWIKYLLWLFQRMNIIKKQKNHEEREFIFRWSSMIICIIHLIPIVVLYFNYEEEEQKNNKLEFNQCWPKSWNCVSLF